jgi:DASS family divalent anion:Na+ symporter
VTSPVTLIGTNPERASRVARWAVVLTVAAIILWYPAPEGVEPRGWRLLAIFAATITGMLLQPLPVGALVLLAVAVAVLTGSITLTFALSGYASPVMWLITAAFMIARAVVHTGLGRRVALLFVSWFGSSSLKLGYALAAADVVVAPVIPSDTARVAGVIFPITRSLAENYESFPGATAKKLGAYLMQCAYHVGCTTSAIFMTSMAANAVSVELAAKHAGVKITWLSWLAASCVPALLSVLALPLLIYKLDPPELKKTPEAQHLAKEHLRAMGAASYEERGLVLILTLMLLGWAAQPWHGIHPVVVAFAGLALMVLSGVMEWDELLAERRAWDVLIWLGAMIMMADGLGAAGVIKAFAAEIGAELQGMAWLPAFVLLMLGYTYVHYVFASMTAQITALYAAFLLLALGAGVPAAVASVALAFFSCLNASLTHYGTAPGPIFFGAGYVTQTTWWRVGFCVMAVQLLVWLGIGLVWWKVLGLW